MNLSWCDSTRAERQTGSPFADLLILSASCSQIARAARLGCRCWQRSVGRCEEVGHFTWISYRVDGILYLIPVYSRTM